MGTGALAVLKLPAELSDLENKQQAMQHKRAGPGVSQPKPAAYSYDPRKRLKPSTPLCVEGLEWQIPRQIKSLAMWPIRAQEGNANGHLSPLSGGQHPGVPVQVCRAVARTYRVDLDRCSGQLIGIMHGQGVDGSFAGGVLHTDLRVLAS